MIPLNFKNAIIEPESNSTNSCPKDISIKLASLILPTNPKLKASGFKKADCNKYSSKTYKAMETSDKLRHCRHWNSKAIKDPIDPPITRNNNT